MRLGLVMEQTLAPVPGGTGRYTRELAAALAACAPVDASITGWTARHRDTTSARVRGVAGPRQFPLSRRALAVAWERGVGPRPSVADVVHAPTLLVPPVGRYRLVVTIHDAVPWTHPETLTKRGVNFHRRMAARAARAADVVVVPTQAVGHELERHLRLPPQGVTVVSPGPTSTLVRPPDEDERAVALGLPDGGYVVTLATFEPRKGLDVLFDAIAQPSAPDLPLVIVGRPGWGGVDPARQAAARGLVSGRVRVLTGLPDRDLSVVLSRATMAVVPSRAEGFGLPVLEAMSFGTPVITSDIPALAEVGSTATLRVPAQDSSALAAAMKQLADDPLLRSRLSSAGLHRAGQFSWKRSAATLWSAYRDLVPGVG